MTARMQSPVLVDLERYAFELLLVSHAAAHGGPALPARVLGPSPREVAARAAPLLETPDAAAMRAFVDAHALDVHRCLIRSSTFAQARGRVAAWVARSLPAANAVVAGAAAPPSRRAGR